MVRTNRRGWILVVTLWAILGGVLGKHALDIRAEQRRDRQRELVLKTMSEGAHLRWLIWQNRDQLRQERCRARKIID